MFSAERKSKIKEILLEYKHVDVSTLGSLLNVSVATVRRDLDQLEATGFLVKLHGGAVLNEDTGSEVQLNNIEDALTSEKSQIGVIANSLIQNNDVIFLGAGTTGLHVAKNLKDKRNVTVLTNNVNAIAELAAQPSLNVIAMGGKVTAIDSSMMMAGSFALTNIEKIYVNKAFISIAGATIADGYTVKDNDEAELYKHVMGRSDMNIIIADYTKYGKRSFVPLDSLQCAKYVITNIDLPTEYKNHYYENDIVVYTSFDNI